VTVATGFLLLAVAALAANASYLSRRILLIWRPAGRNAGKHGAWHVLEIVLLYLATLALARGLEARAGDIYQQGWEFYAVSACLFLVLGYPGFVLRYLWKGAMPRRREEGR
jgi:hypothetical protein